jgi:hypothetical protein
MYIILYVINITTTLKVWKSGSLGNFCHFHCSLIRIWVRFFQNGSASRRAIMRIRSEGPAPYFHRPYTIVQYRYHTYRTATAFFAYRSSAELGLKKMPFAKFLLRFQRKCNKFYFDSFWENLFYVMLKFCQKEKRSYP